MNTVYSNKHYTVGPIDCCESLPLSKVSESEMSEKTLKLYYKNSSHYCIRFNLCSPALNWRCIWPCAEWNRSVGNGTSSSISDSSIPFLHLQQSLLPPLIHHSAQLPLSFTPGLKPTCFTNPTARSFTSSSRTAFMDFCLHRFLWSTPFLFFSFFLIFSFPPLTVF